jgi:hypothetical protein
VCKLFKQDKTCYGNDKGCKFRKTPEEIEIQINKQIQRYNEMGIRDEEIYVLRDNKRTKIHTTVPVMRIEVA